MRDDIRQDLELFGFGPSLLQAALRQFPKKMWCYQPLDDRWSIHDIVIHLADSEASTYVRCRRFIAEPGSAVLKFDGERWAKSLGYFNQSAREALDIIFYLRKATHKLLCALPDHLWDNSVIHPRVGQITLKKWMMIQERHIPHHIDQMRENYSSWAKSHPPRKPATPSPVQSHAARESVSAGLVRPDELKYC
jgi:hypothetical protein